MELISLEMLHEVIGVFCLLLFFYGVSIKDETRLLKLAALGGFIWAFNFALIGAWTASFTVLVISLRYRIAAKGKNLRLCVFFIILHLAIGYLTYIEPKDLFVIGSTMFGTVSVFLCRGAMMRLMFIFGSAAWVIHNIMAGSDTGAVKDAIGMTIHIYWLVIHLKNREFN